MKAALLHDDLLATGSSRALGSIVSAQSSYFHWLESGSHRCAAVWHPVAAPTAQNVTCVLMSSWGIEQLRTQRDSRVLADRLAAIGIPTLHFEYPGASNSAPLVNGGMSPTYADWKLAVGDAVEHAKSLSGNSDVVVIGRRLGALIAASEGPALAARGVIGTVLWEPCVSGASLFRELRLREATRLDTLLSLAHERAFRENGFEADGFWIDNEITSGLSAINLEHCNPAGRIHIIHSGSGPTIDRAVGRLASANSKRSVSIVVTPDASNDLSQWEGAEVSEVAIQSAVDFVKNIVPIHRQTSFPDTSQVVPQRDLLLATMIDFVPAEGQQSITERVQFGGDDNGIFGILATGSTSESVATAVLLLGTGTDVLAGQGDVNAHLARELASRGVPALRMDFRGIGRSTARVGQIENLAYDTERHIDVADMAHVLRRETGAKSIVVIGVCTGGYFGVHAAERAPIDHVIAVNPQFYWDGTPPRDWSAIDSQVLGSRVAEALSSASKWKNLLKGKYPISVVRKGIARALWRLVERVSPWQSDRTAFGPGLPRLDLPGLFPVKVRFDLVFSRDDAGLKHFIAHGVKPTKRVLDQGNVSLHILDNADHTFSTRAMRRRLDDEILRILAVEERHRGA